MRVHTRLGASILLTLLSLVTLVLLLPSAGVTGLHRIAVGTSIDQYAGGLWKWVNGKQQDDSPVRIVVFGDSWVDGAGEEKDDAAVGRGKSWAASLCEVVNCTACMSFAASQRSAAFPASPPTGAVTSKQLYASSPLNITLSPLPDLAAQTQEFLSSEARSTEDNTLFALSFGFWDVYHLASLDYELAQNMTDDAVGQLVYQINILYSHYTEDFYNRTANENATTSDPPPFRLVIPRLFDPTLVPGWLSQHAILPSPSNVAEQQKQAVYLAERWNSRLENALGSWVADGADAEGDDPNELGASEPAANETVISSQWELPRKDIFYYDLPQYLLDIMVEHQLEHAGQSDAAGLGKGQSPFISVSEPCLKKGSAGQEGAGDGVRNTVCAEPQVYLFWDEFNLGGAANAGIGKKVAGMIKEGSRIGRST